MITKNNAMTTLVKSNRIPSLRSMMEELFELPFPAGELQPAINIRETKNHYKLEVAVPCFKKEDFKISTEGGLLKICAETSKDKKEEKENYTRREFSCRSFSRTFTLPVNVDEDHVSAAYHNGILEIELKKSGKSTTGKKAIKID